MLSKREKIKQMRLNIGLSQSQFSRFTGIKLRTIQSWEQGWRRPKEITFKYLKNLIENN